MQMFCQFELRTRTLPDFYIVSSFFYKKSKQARVPTFVWLFSDDATTAKGPGCDEGTNLRLRDFMVVPLMRTRDRLACAVSF